MIVTITPGPCKLITKVTATANDSGGVDLSIDTQCKYYQPLNEELKTLDPYEEVFSTLGENTVFEVCKKYCKHATCPVPSGILKAIEAEANLALPTDVSIVFEKN